MKIEEFLAAPLDVVQGVAPTTIILAAGGTRRSAAAAGISPESDEYARWSRQQMIACCDLIFLHGVEHIVTFAIVESQFQEVTEGYRDKLLEWVDWGLSGPEALADYAERGWRVRLVGGAPFPRLAAAAERLRQATPGTKRPTLWWFVVPDLDAPWRWLVDAIQRTGARTLEEAATALYGEAVPPATLLLSFGKPLVSPALLPPLLYGKTHCYWSQRPSYEMDEQQFRTILYDYAFLRQTWRVDKRGRAEVAAAQGTIWTDGPTLGLGIRLGPFWYPMPVAAPSPDGAVNSAPVPKSGSEPGF